MNGEHLDVDAWVDGELDTASQRAAESHLQSCLTCQERVALAQRLGRAIAKQPVPDPGAAYWARFASRVEARLPPRSSPYERIAGWLLPAGRWGLVRGGAAVAFASFLVFVGMRGFRAPEPSGVAVAPRSQEARERSVAQSPVPTPAPAPPSATAPAPTATQAPTPSTTPVPTAAPPVRQDEALESREAKRKSAPALEAQLESGPGARAEADAQAPSRDQVADPVVEEILAAVQQGRGAAGTATAPPGFAAKPRGQSEATAQDANRPAPMQTPVADPSADRARWLDLAALAWPRREVAALRPALGSIASHLEPYAATDAAAAARARELATHLVATSGDAAERATWIVFLERLP